MAWWLEGGTSRHFGWVRNSSEEIFHISDFFFQEKSIFFGKISIFFEKSAIFLRFVYFLFFLPKIISNPNENRFFAEKSAEKNDFFCPCIYLIQLCIIK